jgi:hypothetical protein
MRVAGTMVYVESSEVEQVPARRTNALGTLAGTYIFQSIYTPDLTGRAWRPMANAAAAWEAVPALVPVQLYIDNTFVCTAARISATEPELTEVKVS